MGELINGRTPEKILFNIRECAYGACLSECPYDSSDECMEDLLKDALNLIERLESERDAALAKVPRWIGVEERLPMEGQLVLVYLGGYTGSLMELCSLDEFGGWVTDMRIAEDAPITHWMPLPEPPKDGE